MEEEAIFCSVVARQVPTHLEVIAGRIRDDGDILWGGSSLLLHVTWGGPITRRFRPSGTLQ